VDDSDMEGRMVQTVALCSAGGWHLVHTMGGPEGGLACMMPVRPLAHPQVPLPAVLDVELEGSSNVAQGSAAGTAATAVMAGSCLAAAPPQAASAGSSEGFMSHEATVASGPSYRMAGAAGAGGGGSFAPAAKRQKVPRVERRAEQQQVESLPPPQLAFFVGSDPQGSREGRSTAARSHAHGGHGDKEHSHADGSGRGVAPSPGAHPHRHPHHHAHLHDGFHTRSVTLSNAPLPLAAFQAFVSDQLLKSPGQTRWQWHGWFRSCACLS
jgi:hypothetical protein